MFYDYLYILNVLFTLCGIRKPFIYSNNKISNVNILHKLSSICIVVGITVFFVKFKIPHLQKEMKKNFDFIADVNDLSCLLVIIVDVINGENTYKQLYETVNCVIHDFKINEMCVNMIVMKMCIWMLIPTLLVVMCLIIPIEVFYVPPPLYLIVIRTPMYLILVHLIIHMYLLLALIRSFNNVMSDILKTGGTAIFFNSFANKKKSKLRYLINPTIEFVEIRRNECLDVISLCKIYDDMNRIVRLLEKCHGFQLLLYIWIMFSSAAVGLTMLILHNMKLPLLLVSRSILPYLFAFIACYINDQIRKEVEITDLLIIKFCISFKCDQSRKNTLQTMKELVTSSRLQVTACNLFNLDYGLILGSIMNALTYTIILIQIVLE